MRKLKLIGIFLTATSISALGQVTGWESLKEKEYSIEYPSEWTLDKSGMMGTKFMLFSPLSSEEDKFKENINLIVQDISAYNLNLDQYVELSEEQVKISITEAHMITSERLKDGSTAFHKVIYTGKQGVFELQFEQYYWIENSKAYVLTFTCEEDQFAEYRVVGEKVLNSFKIK